MSYVTLAEFKAAISISTTDTSNDAELQRALDAATASIDHYTGRTFGPIDAVASARYFFPSEPDKLSVPDLSSVTALAVDTAGDETFTGTIDPTDYDLLPLYLVPGMGGYTEIRLKPTASWFFIVGYQARVTARWGFGASVPAAVQQACILIANRYYHRPSAPFGIVEAPQTGELATITDIDADVQALLGPYVTSAGAGMGAGAAWVMV